MLSYGCFLCGIKIQKHDNLPTHVNENQSVKVTHNVEVKFIVVAPMMIWDAVTDCAFRVWVFV